MEPGGRKVPVLHQVFTLIPFECPTGVWSPGVNGAEAPAEWSFLEEESAEAVASAQPFPKNFQPGDRDPFRGREVRQPARYFATPPAMGAIFEGLIRGDTRFFQTLTTSRPRLSARKLPFPNLDEEEAPLRNDLPEASLPHSMGESPKIGFRLQGCEIAKQEGEGKGGIQEEAMQPALGPFHGFAGWGQCSSASDGLM